MTTQPTALDHVDTERAKLLADLRVKEDIALKASSEAMDARRKLEAYDLAKASTEGMTIETALVAVVGHKDNVLGLKYLRERSKGEWGKSFLRFRGAQWLATNQYVPEISIPNDASPEEMRATRDAILEVLPFIQPGAVDKASRRHLFDRKLISIMDEGLSEVTSHVLTYGEDKWAVIDERASSYRPAIEGSLDECLEYVRSRLSYSLGRKTAA